MKHDKNMDRDSHVDSESLSPAVTALGKPILARKYPQKMNGRTFYLFEVYDPLEKREKTICVHENECYEVEVSVLVRRK